MSEAELINLPAPLEGICTHYQPGCNHVINVKLLNETFNRMNGPGYKIKLQITKILVGSLPNQSTIDGYCISYATDDDFDDLISNFDKFKC